MKLDSFLKYKGAVPEYMWIPAYPGKEGRLVKVVGGCRKTTGKLFVYDEGAGQLHCTSEFDAFLIHNRANPQLMSGIYELAEFYNIEKENILPDGRLILKDGSIFTAQESAQDTLLYLFHSFEKQHAQFVQANKRVAHVDLIFDSVGIPVYIVHLYNENHNHLVEERFESCIEAYTFGYHWCHADVFCANYYLSVSGESHVGNEFKVLGFSHKTAWQCAINRYLLQYSEINLSLEYSGNTATIKVSV